MLKFCSILLSLLLESNVVPREVNDFIDDTCFLRDVRHSNVAAMLGMMFEGGSLMAVWPHAENQNLKTFLTNDDNVRPFSCDLDWFDLEMRLCDVLVFVDVDSG